MVLKMPACSLKLYEDNVADLEAEQASCMSVSVIKLAFLYLTALERMRDNINLYK